MDGLVEGLMHLAEWGRTHTGAMIGMAGGALTLGMLGAFMRRHQERENTSHGSSRWATLKEVKKAGMLAQDGIVLGKLHGKTLRALELHVLLCGPSGGGKDVGVNIPTTLTWPASMLIIDAKDGGENYAKCRKAREQRGPVYRFAPSLPGSHCYNLLDAVRVGTPHEFGDVMILVKDLLAPAKKDTKVSDSGAFFARRGAVVGRGILLYELYTNPPGRATLSHCSQVMHDAEACCAAMSQHPHPEISGQGKRLLTLMKDSERQFAGEWGTFQDALDIFNDPLIAQATSRSDFRLTDLQYGKRPMTLYLGAESVTDLLYLYPLFRAMLQTSYYQLTRMQTYRQRRYDVLMLLNEFPQLGYMDILEQAPAHARSYGIRFLIVIQDLSQLFSTYGRDTAILGNVATKVFHGPVRDDTAERMARMLGPETVEVMSVHTTSGSMGRNRSLAPTARPLMTEAEILGMEKEKEIIWVQGCPHPILADKIRYWEETYS